MPSHDGESEIWLLSTAFTYISSGTACFIKKWELSGVIQQARPDPGWSWVYRARSGLQVVYGMKRYDAKQPNSAAWHPFTVWVILSSPLFLVVKGGTTKPWVLIKMKNEGVRKTEAKQELSGRNQTWAGEKQKLKRCESGWLRIGCSSATISLLKMCLQGNWPMSFRYRQPLSVRTSGMKEKEKHAYLQLWL